MWHYIKTQNPHCNNENNYNDDNAICMQVFGLNALVDYFNVKTRDIWEGNVTTRREI